MIRQLVPVLFAFGANTGDRAVTIRAAQQQLAQADEIRRFAASPLRESIALTLDGLDPDAPRYLNGVASAETTLDPHELLDLMQAIEADHGRVRTTRWGNRTLDVDLILYGGRVVQDERLSVPHPRAHERDFVLAPWLDLDPHAVLMGHGPVAALLARLGDSTIPFDEHAVDVGAGASQVDADADAAQASDAGASQAGAAGPNQVLEDRAPRGDNRA